MELIRAQRISMAVVVRLNPYCKKIEVVGSIRRKKPVAKDIDLVVIVDNLWDFHAELKGMGELVLSGPKLFRLMIGNVQVDIYIATEDTWATLLLIRTGSAENNIRLAALAKKRGWRLAASGDGLFNENGERIAGDTERSIYDMLDLPWQLPEERG